MSEKSELDSMESKNLIIVGAGGFGREVYAWVRQTFDLGREWRFRGFLDDNPAALDGMNYPAILGDIAAYDPGKNDYFLCGLGKPELKKKVVEVLRKKGARFASLVHPSVVMGHNVRMGAGVILCPRVVVTSDIRLGDFVTLNVGSAVGHDSVVGAYTQTSAFCDITGGVTIGEGVFMGSHAAVLPRVRVGDYAVIGAGSVALRDVPAGRTIYGNPARIFKMTSKVK